MKKAKSSRTPERSDIVDLRSDKPFDTLKAQVLVKIADILNPNQLKYDDYNITFTVPRKITNPLPLDSAAKYQHLVTHALQIKTMPSAKIAVEPKLVSDSGLSSVSYTEPARRIVLLPIKKTKTPKMMMGKPKAKGNVKLG